MCNFFQNTGQSIPEICGTNKGQHSNHSLTLMLFRCIKGFIIDYFTDFPYIFDLLGKSVKYVTTICGSIIY